VEPEQFKNYKKTANLNEDINVVIGDLGFARHLGKEELAET
jgi:DNA-directed RNA polymerase subunit N (RpoN/RPB10)